MFGVLAGLHRDLKAYRAVDEYVLVQCLHCAEQDSIDSVHCYEPVFLPPCRWLTSLIPLDYLLINSPFPRFYYRAKATAFMHHLIFSWVLGSKCMRFFLALTYLISSLHRIHPSACLSRMMSSTCMAGTP